MEGVPTAGSAFVDIFGGPIWPQVLVGIGWAFEFAPIWLPIFLIIAACRLWVTYVQSDFIAKQENVLLEIRFPEIVDKSPAAMESILAVLHMTSGESTFIDRLWLGKIRVWHSLEIASFGGQVHFFVWTRKSARQVVINQFYAHYPNIEIQEVPDYATRFDFNLEQYALWGCDFAYTGKDMYSIKTYPEYGLDKDPKDEFKIDPMASLIELLGSIGPRQQMWIQIIIRSHKGGLPTASMFKKEKFDDIAKAEIKSIYTSPEMIDIREEEGGTRTTKKLSKSQIDKISAIQHKMLKYTFDTGIRGIYLAEKDAFDGTFIGGMLGVWKTYSSANYNGFKPTRWLAQYDYPWDDFRERKQNSDRFGVFDAYRKRGWFYEPHVTPFNIMAVDELATIYHLPSAAVKTPSLQRIPSTRREAPANLPL
jgi:hypothetical protein